MGGKLLGDLVGHQTPERVSAEVVWASGLDPAHVLDELGRHVLHPCQWHGLTVQTRVLQAVDRLVVSEETHQVAKAKRVPMKPRQAE